MHKEILTKEQVDLLPLLREFGGKFGLVGGTAIALHIGHRRSIDFDLFSEKGFKNAALEKKIRGAAKIDEIVVDKEGEFTIMLNGVKSTFFHYPFHIDYKSGLDRIIKVPDLLTLAAMKAYALGRRAKWKDYVDLYFVIKYFHTLDEISEKCREIFGDSFNEKLLRVQLPYFDDVNYIEKIEYMKGFKISDKEVKKALVEFSVS
ncbi:MAG: nucleotidyl transferase AbiEii/AbiGii toxin family protein [Patescibacteria group bacterium]|nr:nucleotidyl transferase AbiEii/AbiGii toxin family protein [Patescibacteria group bacterium]